MFSHNIQRLPKYNNKFNKYDSNNIATLAAVEPLEVDRIWGFTN